MSTRGTLCSEGMGGNAPLKTLACKYGAVLQKIGLDCSGYSVSLPKNSCIATLLKVRKRFFIHSDSDYVALKNC